MGKFQIFVNQKNTHLMLFFFLLNKIADSVNDFIAGKNCLYKYIPP